MSHELSREQLAETLTMWGLISVTAGGTDGQEA